MTRGNLTPKGRVEVRCLVHTDQLLHEGSYQFPGHFGFIVSEGRCRLEAKRLVRERLGLRRLRQQFRDDSEIRQVQRPGNRIGRGKSGLLHGSNIAGERSKVVQRLVES